MSATSAIISRPWERPFWKPARHKEGVLIYLVLIHVLAITGIILYPLPGLTVLCVALLFAGLGGLGTTVCYHRALAHKTVKLHPAVEHFLIFWAIFNGSGHPASWVGYHRLHHAEADTPDDISSPSQGGFWWAHLRWLYQSAPADTQRWCPEYSRGIYRFWALAEGPIILLSIACGIVLGWAGLFWIGAFRLVHSLHGQCAVNSLTHLGKSHDGDSSQNMWWLGPLQFTAWGENWHRNHHSAAGTARLGHKWWQVDIGWYVIVLLEAVGLATNVKRLRARA